MPRRHQAPRRRRRDAFLGELAEKKFLGTDADAEAGIRDVLVTWPPQSVQTDVMAWAMCSCSSPSSQ